MDRPNKRRETTQWGNYLAATLLGFLSLTATTTSGCKYGASDRIAVLLAFGIVLLGSAAVLAVPLALSRMRRPRQRIPLFDARMDSSPFSPSQVSEAMQFFALEWYRSFHTRILRPLDDMDIYWVRGAYFVADESMTDGVMVSKTRIRIAFVEKQKLGETAFFRELTRAMIWATEAGDDGDADHLGDKHSGWSEAHEQLIIRCKRKFSD